MVPLIRVERMTY